MVHTYNITGMTCGNCAQKVKSALEKLQGIDSAEVNLEQKQAVVTMSRHINTAELNKAVSEAGNYSLTENGISSHSGHAVEIVEKKSFITTYKPILLIFAYITGFSVLSEFFSSGFNIMHAMHVFMGGFFIAFSFFKLLDLKGFAYSYMSYDVIAKKWVGWGYIYPLVELALGAAFIFHYQIFAATVITLVVMGISSIGVIQSLVSKKKFQCACLGTVFNLPMSNITLIEDLLMVVMSIVMLLM